MVPVTASQTLRLIHEISEQHGIHLDLTKAIERILKRVSDNGRRADEVAAVYQELRS